MQKLDKEYFLKNIKNILVKGVVPPISNKEINEFTIGKSYCYSIHDNPELIKAQRWLNRYLQDSIPLNSAAVGFRKNYSYLHLFEPHKQNYHFLRLDIRSFFHSININDIKNTFQIYFDDTYIDASKNQSLLNAFINLVTYRIPEDSNNINLRGTEVLPMGIITSPVISNIIFRKVDILIQKFCSNTDIIYSRYADDMLFSSTKESTFVHSENFINEIAILLSTMDFKINKAKTIKEKHTISLNGYTIQYSEYGDSFLGMSAPEKIINEFRLSNKKTKIIDKMLYMIKKKKSSQTILKKLFDYKLEVSNFKYPIKNKDTVNEYYNDQLLNKLTGYRSYLLSFIKFNNIYNCSQEKTKTKYSETVDTMDKIINDLE